MYRTVSSAAGRNMGIGVIQDKGNRQWMIAVFAGERKKMPQHGVGAAARQSV